MKLPSADRETLRRLAADYAAAAADPVNVRRAEAWRALNDLEPVRPMLFVNEYPWNELDVDGELACVCAEPEAREVESFLRRALYQWRHVSFDLVLSPWIECRAEIRDSDYGLPVEEDILATGADNSVVSHRYLPVLRDFPDLGKIRLPVVVHDREATERRFAWMSAAFSGILPVRRVGIRTYWHALWDRLIRWLGVENAMLDLLDRPDFVNACVARLAAALDARADQWEREGLLSPGANNTRVGSGGYGYTGELPADGPDLGLPTRQLWGCANAQIFTAVSPEMHWEFAVRHEIPWLERWGMNYYGCCEALHHKAEVLRRIPRLRKVSVSPAADLGRMAEETGGRLVLSYKPNPAVFAGDAFDLAAAEADLRRALAAARGCAVEVVMKDISTVRHEPRRLWEWAAMAHRTLASGQP